MTAQTRYYKIYDDKYIPGRWHLRMPLGGEGELFDTCQFKEGKALSIEGTIRLSMKPTGMALDFSHSMGIPVVNRRVVSLLERLGIEKEVQFIPVRVDGQTEPYFILNALRVIECIDDARCEAVLYWLPEDNRPDQEGEYRNVVGMKIDPAKVGDANIFRPWGWTVVLIVSERVKLAMEAEGITGTRFVEV